ncbi:MAG: GTP 3',8-cyclase MoaA [Dehalococcoidia bacterium]|nr:GTP 3',8-cyclase MoaA [Dehalococcoidia bacterium]
MTGAPDSCGRSINYLRVSVTDRCNLRCIYCMPPSGVPLLRQSDILSYEEIGTVVRATAEVGINKIRLTGGEPLVRAQLPRLVEMLCEVQGVEEVSLTTNGTLLSRHALELKQAGLTRVNISLDTLRADRYRGITRLGELTAVLHGIETAQEAGLHPVKINVVLIRGVNDDEVLDFAAMTVDREWHVRFIERMPFNGEVDFVPTSEVQQRIGVLGKLEPRVAPTGNGPAAYYRLPGARGTIGFITPLTEPAFCSRCNRLRLTPDGKLRPCLLGEAEIDLRRLLRNNASPETLRRLVQQAVASKPQRHHLEAGRTNPPDADPERSRRTTGEGGGPKRRMSQIGG